LASRSRESGSGSHRSWSSSGVLPHACGEGWSRGVPPGTQQQDGRALVRRSCQRSAPSGAAGVTSGGTSPLSLPQGEARVGRTRNNARLAPLMATYAAPTARRSLTTSWARAFSFFNNADRCNFVDIITPFEVWLPLLKLLNFMQDVWVRPVDYVSKLATKFSGLTQTLLTNNLFTTGAWDWSESATWKFGPRRANMSPRG